jgi:hypothetical protein
MAGNVNGLFWSQMGQSGASFGLGVPPKAIFPNNPRRRVALAVVFCRESVEVGAQP